MHGICKLKLSVGLFKELGTLPWVLACEFARKEA